MAFPNITILVVTYNRIDLLKNTIEALARNLDYPGNQLHWLIADDSSPDDYLKKVSEWPFWEGKSVVFNKTEVNSGWGANVNQALRKVATDIVLQIEDDWELTKKLDLKEGVALLQARPEIGYIRYRGHGGNDMIYQQQETDISQYYPGYYPAENMSNKVQYLLLRRESGAPYLYTNGLHLKTLNFHRYYGNYSEGLKLGRTEEAMACRVKERMNDEGAPKLVILPEWINMGMKHLGKSYQLTALDRGIG